MARSTVLLFALVFPTAMTWGYFTQAGPYARPLYSAGKIIQFALPLLWWLIVEPARLRPSGPRRSGLLAGVLFGAVVAAAILALHHFWLQHHALMGPLAAEARSKIAAFGLTTPVRFVMFAAFLSLAHAGLEEYYWRAFVFAELRKLVPVAAAVVLSSLGFMAHHVVVLAVYFPGRFWTAAVPLSFAVGCGGAIWAWMFHRWGSVYPAWIGHALVDAALMAVGYQMLWP